VGNEFGDRKETETTQNISMAIFSFGMDVSGEVFVLNDDSIVVAINDSTFRRVHNLVSRDGIKSISSNIFIKDKNGSLVLMVDSNMVRITRSGNGYNLDSIGKFSYCSGRYAKFTNRYAVDDDGTLWFTDVRDSALQLLQWDGNKLKRYDMDFKLVKSADELSDIHIAAGGGFVFCVYDTSYYQSDFEQYQYKLVILKWNLTESIKERIEIDEKIEIKIKNVFAINGLLHMLIWNGSDEYEIDYMVDSSLIKKADVNCGDGFSLDILKRNSQEMYLYSDKVIIQVTDTTIVKNLYSDCDALFLDTSNQVILRDQYSKKFINITNLPGF
jgi:hypothetical protein